VPQLAGGVCRTVPLRSQPEASDADGGWRLCVCVGGGGIACAAPTREILEGGGGGCGVGGGAG
jgi:hypothetical protein